MSSDAVHLLVLVHGMWGNPGHLAFLDKTIRERCCQPTSETGPNGERLEVLLAQTNKDENTYDGVDWGGERVAEEIYEAIKRLKDAGRTVTRFSITGYSLGGLVSRYVVGILYQRGFFENVTPVNFNTFATPHIGLPRYRSMLSSLASYLGPKLLSRTGEQFWIVDKWSARGRPLVEVMADPDRVFYQALCQFQHLRIYANAINDLTVPYPTAAIEAEDIFINHETNGIEIELDDQYIPRIKSYRLPDTPLPPPPEPKPLTVNWFKQYSVPIPPPLRVRFPLNLAVYAAIPVLLPIFFTLVLTRLSLASHASRSRLKLLENEDEASMQQRLVHVLAQLERGVEDAVADMIDDPGHSPVAASAAAPVPATAPATTLASAVTSSTSTPTGTAEPTPLASSDTLAPAPASAPISKTKAESPSASAAELKVLARESDALAPPQHVILSETQLRLVRLLNTLPGLKKELAFIKPVRNAHGPIICRGDYRYFASYLTGEGVVRHWADVFIM